MEYAPWGPLSRQEGSVDPTHGFTGQELDPESGLYYYGARYYDSDIGRFISPDSLIQEPLNPQSLNRYSYVINNPVNHTDPTGHCIFIIDCFFEFLISYFVEAEIAAAIESDIAASITPPMVAANLFTTAMTITIQSGAFNTPKSGPTIQQPGTPTSPALQANGNGGPGGCGAGDDSCNNGVVVSNEVLIARATCFLSDCRGSKKPEGMPWTIGDIFKGQERGPCTMNPNGKGCRTGPGTENPNQKSLKVSPDTWENTDVETANRLDRTIQRRICTLGLVLCNIEIGNDIC